MGLLIANRCGVILIGTGLSAEDLGFESPLCVGTNSQSTRLAEMWGLRLDPVVGVCYGSFPKAGWLHRYMQFIHWACVQYRWRCVSLEEKAHLGRPLVATPNNSLVLNTAWIAGRGDSEMILPIWPLTVDNRGRRLIPWPCLVHSVVVM